MIFHEIREEVGGMKKEERMAKKQREDQALNRVLWWFGGAVILEFFLLLLNRFYINFDASGVGLARGIFRFLRIFAWVCLVAAVLLGAWWGAKKAKGGKTFLPGVSFAVAFALFFCSFVAGVWKSTGVQFLYVCVPVTAVLALVYYLYQREFFLVAVQGGLALFALWFYRKLIYVQPQAVYIIFAVAGVLTLGLVAVFVLLQRNKGMLGKTRILPKKANYIPLYLAAGVTVLALLAALAFGSVAAYGTLFAVVAWLFGAAIYYTVRLM